MYHSVNLIWGTTCSAWKDILLTTPALKLNYRIFPTRGEVRWRSATTWLEMDIHILKKENVFVCADVYDRMHMQTGHRKLKNVVLICYIVFLLSLLATFVICARHPVLRTKPGLMLLNLVVALFFVQLLCILNSFAFFKSSLTVCQILATTQHYFWLASFAWMVCISLDLFRCLSKITASALSHVGLMNKFYVIAGWLIPSPIPLSATYLTVTEAMFAYDLKTCWLSGPKLRFTSLHYLYSASSWPMFASRQCVPTVFVPHGKMPHL